MVLKEWEELWKLYKNSMPIKALRTWHYWYIWLLFVLISLAGVGVVVSLSRGWVWGKFLGLPLFLVFTWLLNSMIHKGFEREFATLYTTYGLKHYPRARRRLYLHYARFLGRLIDQKYTTSCNGLQSKWIRTAISGNWGPHYVHLSIPPGPDSVPLRLQSTGWACNQQCWDHIICDETASPSSACPYWSCNAGASGERPGGAPVSYASRPGHGCVSPHQKPPY
jgi:hypothetical protein